MLTDLPADEHDERPLMEVYRSFHPSHCGLVQYSEDIRELLIQVREKSTKKTLEFIQELTRARMRTQKIIRDAIKQSLGDEVEDNRVLDAQIMFGEFDGSSIEQLKKSEIIQRMLEERRDLILRITDYINS